MLYLVWQMGAAIENCFIVILFAVSFVDQVHCWHWTDSVFKRDYVVVVEIFQLILSWRTTQAALNPSRSGRPSAQLNRKKLAAYICLFQDRPESCPGETVKNKNNLYTTEKKTMGKTWSCCAATDRFVVLFFFFLQEILSQDSAQLIEKSYLLTRLGLNLSSATQVPVFSFLFCCHCNSFLNPADRVELLADTSESELAFCRTSRLCGCHCSQ